MAPSYIVPLYEMRSHMDCGTRRQCVQENQSYRSAALDLHNIYPALSRIALDRRNSQFGELEDTVTEKFPSLRCNYRSSLRVTEPQDNAKGNVARALIYMMQTYGLNVPLSISIDVLVKWNDIDPPDDHEKTRNDLIEKIQGSRNQFIDDPTMLKELARKKM